MADPGQQLLEMVNARVAKGENRPFAEREVFAAHPALVHQWHRGEGQEPPEPPKREEPAEVDPGSLLLALTSARIRLGLSPERARAITFAEHPHVFAAYNEGRMIPVADKVGAAPTIVCFRSLDGDVAGDQLLRVPVFKAGKWNGRAYTTGDLDSMIAAFAGGHFEPPLKVGHNKAPDVPAVGRVARLWREGDTLFADFEGIDPEAMAGIRTGKWLTLSCEIVFDMERAGRKYRAALLGVSLLGGHAPGVDLPPLREAVAA